MSLLSTLMTYTLPRSHTVRLRTLIYLRWLAVLGQAIAVFVATQYLGIDLRLDMIATIIGLSVALNIGQSLILPQNMRLNQRDATLTLFFDICQLAALLFLTGGLTNPFAALILAQTIIAASVLTLNATVFLAAVSLFFIGLLALLHQPLMLQTGEVLDIPRLLTIGSWAALSIAVVFLGVYARLVSIETSNMSEALTATQLALEREQKLTALGGVVAATAHELGTPLATIMMVSAEMADELKDRPDLLEDVELIRAQARRCRDILADMGRTGHDDLHLRHAPFSAVVAEAAEPHRHRGKEVILRIRGEVGETAGADQPQIPRRSEVIHGVRNLVQNAVDFAATAVWIDLDWTDEVLTLRVGDDGKGYPSELLGRIGDPFLRGRFARPGGDPERPAYKGMGLGLFIAKTLLERTGARLTFANGSKRGKGTVPLSERRATGAIVEVVWRRDEFETRRDTVRGALGTNRPLEV
ncbi:sensor histidine kinase RegB [Oceanibium sediminis]|uniref:sensor histidine kinase RegB n=1 Tax=Oceanibium sediminis TaxID=2026339 RepID=UPI000DD4DE74|nr:ActS/PrrB/RegB family redox-sensitive histidine kinase [Oceanibium sediminis]